MILSRVIASLVGAARQMAAGGPPVPSHHSPLFKSSPKPAVRAGVEPTVVALMALMLDGRLAR